MKFCFFWLLCSQLLAAEASTILFPQAVYKFFAKNAPSILESTGGFSKEFEIKNMSCRFSGNFNGTSDKSCTFESTHNGKIFDLKVSAESILLLMNSFKPTLDQKNEPGTTYLELGSFSCGVIDPISSLDQQYWCERSLN